MPYLVYNTPNSNFVSYQYVNPAIDDIETEKYLLQYQNKKHNLGITNIRVVDESPKQIGNDWFIDGEKCIEPEWSKIEREYDENRNYADDDGEDYYDLIRKICFD